MIEKTTVKRSFLCGRYSCETGKDEKPTFPESSFDVPTLLLCLGTLLLLSVSSVGAASRYTAGKNFSGVVRKVIDGDSLLVSRGHGVQEIRLYGIDAPEYDQPGAAATKKWLRRRIQGRRVSVQGFNRDRFGRLVAVVRQGDDVINLRLVEEGLVWIYSRYCHRSFCRSWKSAECSARSRRLKLWRQEHPIPPWVWRHRKP